MLNKKGFTVIETVIAMAIVLLISVTAMNITISANSITRQSESRFRAQQTAENVITLYRFCDEREDFLARLAELSFAPVPEQPLCFAAGDLIYRVRVEVAEDYGSITAFVESTETEEAFCTLPFRKGGQP